jgi:hypothetical protein
MITTTNKAGNKENAGNTDNAGNAGNGGNAGNTGNTNNTGNTDNVVRNRDGSGTTPSIPQGNAINLQPISSITYEREEEEEKNGSDTVATDKVIVKNFTKHKIDIVKLLNAPLQLKFDKRGPKVLIYHTHTSESYDAGAMWRSWPTGPPCSRR